jgi:putative peptide zinc metalloprotease protein
MQPATDTSTVDLARTCLKLRSDLAFIPQRYGGQLWVHIEVAATSGFYRVGFTEYVFLSLLDGRTTFSEALAITARTQGAAALTEDHAHTLYRWILDQDLGRFTDTQVDEGRYSAGPKQQDAGQQAARWNPFWIRIPLGRPDNLLKRLEPALGWLFSIPATIVALVFIISSAVRLFAAREDFAAASRQVFAPENWLWLLVAWILLKLVHETAHGLVCRRYGGTVRASGVILAFFAPLAYVDVTSSWAFSSRWQRIHTAVAGIYIELLTAAIATGFWLSAESELASHLLHNVIVMASLSTILFNANPLMRFDGYYVLSDLLEIPNLASRASEVVRRTLQKLLLGVHPAEAVEAGTRRRTLMLYGLAAAGWKVVICTSLVIAASVLFHGAGVALAVAGIVAWVGVPAVRLGQWIGNTASNDPVRMARAVMLTAALVGIVSAALLWTPVPFGATAPGIVQLPDGSAVRAEVDGFIEELHVLPGQNVVIGELLVTLRNRELESKHADLLLQLRQAQLRRQAAINEHEAADAKVAADLETALGTRLRQSAEQVAGLRLCARVDGRVVLPHVDELRGRYVREGEQLLSIDNHLPRQLHISVAQQDQPQVQTMAGQSIRVRAGTRAAFDGRLTRINPRATLSLKYPALAASEGSDLAVVEDGEGDYRFTEHRFDAVIELPAEVSACLRAGERGYAVFSSASPTLASHVYCVMSDWIETQFNIADQQTM